MAEPEEEGEEGEVAQEEGEDVEEPVQEAETQAIAAC